MHLHPSFDGVPTATQTLCPFISWQNSERWNVAFNNSRKSFSSTLLPSVISHLTSAKQLNYMSLAHKPATISFHSRETARCVRGWHHATDSHMELLSRIPIWKLARYKKSSPHRRERKTLAAKTPSSSETITVHNEMIMHTALRKFCREKSTTDRYSNPVHFSELPSKTSSVTSIEDGE